MKKIQVKNLCTAVIGIYLSVVNTRYFHMNQLDIFMYPVPELFIFIFFLGGGVEKSVSGRKERRCRITGAGLRHHQQDDSPTALTSSSLY